MIKVGLLLPVHLERSVTARVMVSALQECAYSVYKPIRAVIACRS